MGRAQQRTGSYEAHWFFGSDLASSVMFACGVGVGGGGWHRACRGCYFVDKGVVGAGIIQHP